MARSIRTQGKRRDRQDTVSIDIVVKQQTANESALVSSTHSELPIMFFPLSHHRPSTRPILPPLPPSQIQYLQTGTNNSPQRRTTNIPPTKSPTPATMLTFPGSLSGANICVRKKRDHALSFGSTRGRRENCAGVRCAGPEWGGAARRAIALFAVGFFFKVMCGCVYGMQKVGDKASAR